MGRLYSTFRSNLSKNFSFGCLHPCRCADGREIWHGGGDRRRRGPSVPSSVPNFTPIGATCRPGIRGARRAGAVWWDLRLASLLTQLLVSSLLLLLFGSARQIKLAIRQLLGARKYSVGLSCRVVSYNVLTSNITFTMFDVSVTTLLREIAELVHMMKLLLLLNK